MEGEGSHPLSPHCLTAPARGDQGGGRAVGERAELVRGEG